MQGPPGFRPPPGGPAGPPARKDAGTLPAWFAFALPLAAAIAATMLDFLFEAIHLGSWIWWAATAVCFGGAGFTGGLMTRASKPVAIAGIVTGAVLHAASTMALYMLLIGSRAGAAGAAFGVLVGILPAAINLGIGVGTGVTGVLQGAHQRDAFGRKG